MYKLKSIFLVFILFFFWGVSFAGELPKRIISLGPSLTEEMYLLGEEDKLVGCTAYCLPKTSKERVATIIDVNLEKAVSLKPDLVLATALTNAKDIERLRSFGIVVEVFGQPRDFDELCSQFLKLADLLGKRSLADELVEEAKLKAEKIEAKIASLDKFKVFVQVGVKPLFSVNKDSFINDLIERAGGINIAKLTEKGFFSREEVLKQNPDTIIITAMGLDERIEKEIWLKYKDLNAVKKNRIFVLDSYKLCSPTPLKFVDALEEVVCILHPEAGK